MAHNAAKLLFAQAGVMFNYVRQKISVHRASCGCNKGVITAGDVQFLSLTEQNSCRIPWFTVWFRVLSGKVSQKSKVISCTKSKAAGGGISNTPAAVYV